MNREGLGQIFYGPDGLRSGWRIALFALLMAGLLLVGGLVISLLPPLPMLGEFAASSAIMLAAAVVAGWVLLQRLDGRPAGALGFAWTSRTPAELIGGLAVGIAAMGVIVAGLAAAGMISYQPIAGTLGGYLGALLSHLVVMALAAAAEEAIFRGYPFQVLVQGIGPVAATLVGSVLFAVAHAWNPEIGLIALVNLFVAGVLLSVAYLRTRSLWFATAVHLGWNWMMASVLALPVSGLDYFQTPFYQPLITGPEWITGGAFGPEGGLAATLGFALALLAVLRLPWFVQPAEVRALRPLVNQRMEPS